MINQLNTHTTALALREAGRYSLVDGIPYRDYGIHLSGRDGVFDDFMDSMNNPVVWEISYSIKKNLK